MERAFDVHIDMIQTGIRNVNLVDVQLLERKVSSEIANALSRVDPDTVCEEKAIQLQSSGQGLIEKINIFASEKDQQKSKDLALHSLAEFKSALQNCPPSNEVKSLRLE